VETLLTFFRSIYPRSMEYSSSSSTSGMIFHPAYLIFSNAAFTSPLLLSLATLLATSKIVCTFGYPRQLLELHWLRLSLLSVARMIFMKAADLVMSSRCFSCFSSSCEGWNIRYNSYKGDYKVIRCHSTGSHINIFLEEGLTCF